MAPLWNLNCRYCFRDGRLRDLARRASLKDLNLTACCLCALRFVETFDDTISFQPRKPGDPKDPIKLVDLVLETYGEQTIGLLGLFRTD